MIVLLDTNVLGRLTQRDHAMHPVAVAAIEQLIENGHELRVVPQVFYEFWAIATRRILENGFGFTVEQTAREIQRFKVVFPPLRDERGILELWEKLVGQYEVRGKNSHDARLVAAMQKHGMSRLLTFNGADFRRYSEIEVLDPETIVAK